MFEYVIQACSDLSQHIATRDFGYDGSTATEGIRVLYRNGVLDGATMSTLVTTIGFTNFLPG